MNEVTDPGILQQLNSQSQPQLKEVSDPGLLAQLNDNTIQSGTNPSQSSLMNAVDRINAFGGGVAKGLADIPQAMGDVTPFVLQHLKIISPDTANKLYKANAANADLLRPHEGSIPAEAIKEHPNYALAGKLGADVGGTALGMQGVGLLGEAASGLIPSAPTAAGVLGRSLGMGVLGASMAPPQNKNMAFGINAAMSPAFDALGYGLSKLGSKGEAINEISNTLGSSSKSKVNQAYQTIKDFDFTPEDQAATTGISSKINELIGAGENLSKKQVKLLSNAASQLQTMDNHSDLLNVLQNLGSESKSFGGLNAPDSVREAYVGIKSGIKDIINQAAIRNEVPDALQTATELAQQNRIGSKIFAGMSSDPTSFSFQSASKRLAVAIDKYSSMSNFENTVGVLQGLKKLSDVAAAKPMSALISHSLGAAIGGEIGYKLTDSGAGAAAGAALGGMGGPVVFNALRSMAYSPAGQSLLKSLSNPGVTQQMTRDVLKSIVVGVSSTGLNSTQIK